MPPPIASATSSIAPEALSTEHSPAPAAKATVARPSSNSRWALPAPLARLSPFRHKMSSVAVHPKPGGAPRALLRDIAPDANAGRGGPKRQHGAEQRFGPSAPRSETHSEFSGSTDASRQRLGHLRNQLSSLISTQPSTTDVLNSILAPNASRDTVAAAHSRIQATRRQADSSTEGPTVGGKVNQLPFLERHRVMFSLPPENRHYLTADVRRSRGKTSVIMIEPLGLERGGYKQYWEQNYLPFLKSQFGDDVSVTVLTLDTQISGSDCRIYGLSHASKMADNPALFDALHRQNISGAPLKTSLGGEAKTYLEDGNVRVVDGMGVLPSDFVKHAQSDKTLDAWMDANPSAYANASVNKVGQTLTERYDAHATTRVQTPQRLEYARMQGHNPPIKSTKTSTSIEEKRLTYIDRAMAYFSQAPVAQCEQVLAGMNRVDPTSADMGRPWAHWRREWGPSPDSLHHNMNKPGA